MEELARHYGRSPDSISIEEVRDYLHYLIVTKKLSLQLLQPQDGGDQLLLSTGPAPKTIDLRVPMKRSGGCPNRSAVRRSPG